MSGCNELIDKKICGEPIIRDGKCERHKIERRKSLFVDRRHIGTSDTPPSCGNAWCRVIFGITDHHVMCPDRGPGWA